MQNVKKKIQDGEKLQDKIENAETGTEKKSQ